MRVHVLQHAAFERLGSIASWLEERRARVSVTPFFESDELPSLREVDMVIALGGPMSVNDEAQFPWLIAEKRFLREAIRDGIPVLGVCLGAQLIASALGAKVRRNEWTEIGWFPVIAERVPSTIVALPPTSLVLHWHGETFDLPDGAVRLARSAGCENQAFQIGESVIALQFHLEMTPDTVAGMIEHCGDELVAGTYVQQERELKDATLEQYAQGHQLMTRILDYLAANRSVTTEPRGNAGRPDRIVSE